ncbi:hypothetical protein G7066_01295 [Leucobacter coleopterorum]|uniref:DUF559 domain-containing protein n=1 Tax=Leucobacter coleopterorum TaxID=2714933 RepID=A0ABX6JTR5_9MICO|nr:hypothetical protein [Leucobacter coleopterorum]QIM17681.1 hypothetical protein G7066_01295 [Leucobacter coleopterorum]
MSDQRTIRREYGPRAFLVREAHQRGISRGALANPKLRSPFTGVRSASSVGATLRERALAFIPLLRPGDRFSHTTALALLGCPIYVDEKTSIDIESAAGHSPFRRRGVNGHRASPNFRTLWLRIPEHEDPDFWQFGPIPVVTPLHAAIQASTQLPFQEIVVALDSLLSENTRRFDETAKVEVEELETARIHARGHRGAQKFRVATQFARVGADSRMESLTRLIGERAGLRNLTLQHAVRDPFGRLIGHFDLADEASLSLFEYDGEQHRLKTKQYRHDLVRLDAARDAGWRPFRVHVEDILDTPEETGHKMLLHTGRTPLRLPTPHKLLLEERADGNTVSAQPKYFVELMMSN